MRPFFLVDAQGADRQRDLVHMLQSDYGDTAVSDVENQLILNQTFQRKVESGKAWWILKNAAYFVALLSRSQHRGS